MTTRSHICAFDW